MNDEDLITRLREATDAPPVDAERFSAGLRRRKQRFIAGSSALLAGVLGVAWLVAAPVPMQSLPDAPEIAVTTPAPRTTVQGTARDLEGQPLVGATVSAGGQTVFTDASGRFSLAGEADATLRIDAPGHATTWARVRQGQDVNATALRTDFTGVLDGAAGGRLIGPDGMSLTLPPRGVKDAEGHVVNGPIGVRWTVLRTPEALAGAPGDLATTIDGTETPLQSFGMAEVVLTGVDGDELDLVADAEISIPLVDGHPFREGQDVGLYAFDEDSGLWNREGHGVVHDDTMVATVGHFSWWNCDEPLQNTGCVCGHVRVDDVFEQKPQVVVRAIGVRYLLSSRTRSAEDGGFCVNAAPASAVNLKVWQPIGERCLVGESGPVVTSRAGTAVEIDASACARADVVASVVPCSDDVILNRDLQGPRVTVEPVPAMPAVPQGDRIQLRAWVPEPLPPHTDVYLRCGDEDWALWPKSGIGLVPSVPMPAPAQCQIKFYQGRAFDFTTQPGVTRVSCNVLQRGSGCTLGEDGDSLPADRLHLVVWSGEGVPHRYFDIRCGDLDYEAFRRVPLVGGGGDAPIDPGAPCELALRSGADSVFYRFLATPGVNETFCDFTDGTGCRPGRPERPKPTDTP